MDRTILVGVGGAGSSIADKIGRHLGCDVLAVNLARDLKSGAARDRYLPLEICGGRLPTISMVEAAVGEVSGKFQELLVGKRKVVIAVGLGGHTGSWAAPELAKIARSLGLHVTAVLTLPFSVEVERRAVSDAALQKLQGEVDVMILHDHADESPTGNALRESLDEYFDRIAKELSAKLVTLTGRELNGQ